MIIAYLRNKNNGMIYKAVNNSLLLMWSPNAKKYIRCCTKYHELFINDYIDNFELLNEAEVVNK